MFVCCVCCVCELYISTMRLQRLKLDCCLKEEEKGEDGLCKNENNLYSFFCNSLK